MEQFTVAKLIKELTKVKKDHGGETLVKIHLKSAGDLCDGDYSHDDFGLYIEKITEIDGDTGKPKKRKMKTLSIYAGDYCPEDYKK